MKLKAYSFSLFYCLFILFLLNSCTSNSDTDNSKGLEPDTMMQSTVNSSSNQPNISGQSMEVKTFEVIDSTSKKSLGWGYDIYIDGKRSIHQPIIPAIPGNNSFKSAEKANIAGVYAMNKMQKTGSLPTLSLAELDSLGVTK